ncbi:hypothetical protein YTPLAS18_14330 [Nitrospira sp.]|nr:hypothetical protein YTPLAS18_14330 [Nitrospira sp.]
MEPQDVRPQPTPKGPLIVGSMIVSLAVAAAVLQVLYDPPRETSGWRTATIMAGDISARELNELGFRGQSIHYSDGDRVVVLLGDSQVEARPGCAFGWMPERRLQTHLERLTGLRVKVFTLGSSGYGQDQQLLVLREYFARFRADLVVLWETPANDIWNNLFPTHWPANGMPKPTFRLEEGQLVGPSEVMGALLPVPRTWVGFLLQRFGRTPGRDERWEQFLPPAYQALASYDGPVNLAWERDESLLVDENLLTEKSHRSLYLTPISPRMRYGIQLTRALMQEARHLAQEHGATYVTLVSSPARVDSLPVKNLEAEVYRFRGRYYRASQRQRYDTLREINEGFLSYDIPVTVDEPEIGPMDGHLNEHAVDQVMRDLAAKVGPLLLDHSSHTAISLQLERAG